MGLPEKIGTEARPHTNHKFRYVPFLSGLVLGTIEIKEPEETAVKDQASVMASVLLTGKLPGEGGVYTRRHDGALACVDALPAEVNGSGLITLHPGLKRDVSKTDGSVLNTSLLLEQTEDGEVTIFGLRLNTSNDPFQIYEYNIPRYAIPPNGLVTIPLGSLDFGKYDYSDVCAGTGVLEIKQSPTVY